MKQYTRIYMDSNGVITHVHTQETPILNEPVESSGIASSIDRIIEHDGVFERARPILDSLESDGAGGLRNKPNLPSRAVKDGIVRPLSPDEAKQTSKPKL